jgi:hypothetical protein
MEKRLTTISFLFILFKDKDCEGLMGEIDEYTIGNHTFTLAHPLKILFHVFQPGHVFSDPVHCSILNNLQLVKDYLENHKRSMNVLPGCISRKLGESTWTPDNI